MDYAAMFLWHTEFQHEKNRSNGLVGAVSCIYMPAPAIKSVSSFGNKLLRWSSKSILAVVGLLVVLAIAGLAYQFIREQRDTRRFPQRGKSIQLEKVKMNLDSTGLGGLTVILESGSGIPALGWVKVQREVARFTRVCSYDRAGYGWSDASPYPRTSLQIAAELGALLKPRVNRGHM
jgi:hypothetical protein